MYFNTAFDYSGGSLGIINSLINTPHPVKLYLATGKSLIINVTGLEAESGGSPVSSWLFRGYTTDNRKVSGYYNGVTLNGNIKEGW